MPNVVATGQISIIDHNDALSLTAYVTTNRTKTQMYNPDNGSYTPDWTKEPVTLAPSLFILGNADDIIATNNVKSVAWYDVSEGSRVRINNGSLNGAYSIINGRDLRINENLLAGKTGKEFMVHIVYHDDSTDLDLPIEAGISFSRVVNGSGIADAVAWLPDGHVFKNDAVEALTAQCDFWRGSLIDDNDVSYQWYKKDPTQSTDVGGGVGWKKLTNSSGMHTGVTTNKITIHADAVLGYAVFKCIIKDEDSESHSYGKEFVDTVTLSDQSDPIQCTVESSGGTVFKNGDGQATLTARLYRAGGEIDQDGSKYTYKWYKYDNTSKLVTGWGGSTDYQTGKSIEVGSGDINAKATFTVRVGG